MSLTLFIRLETIHFLPHCRPIFSFGFKNFQAIPKNFGLGNVKKSPGKVKVIASGNIHIMGACVSGGEICFFFTSIFELITFTKAKLNRLNI